MRKNSQTSQGNAPVIEKTHRVTFALLVTLFFAWGLAANMTDTLLAAFKRIMSMSDFETTFVQYAFYGAYFCFAIPAALLVQKFTYKTGILFGLLLYIAGALLFFPASQTMEYIHFLFALYILASGLSFLETSTNAYVVSIGSEETAAQRLNLAQAFNPIGAITGVLLSKYFILANLNSADAGQRSLMSAEQLEAIQRAELAAVMNPYVGVALVLCAVWLAIAVKKMPKLSDQGSKLGFLDGAQRLLNNPNYVAAVLAQFLYVGAQIGIWSFTIRFVMQELAVNEATAASYYTASLVAFLFARFICAGLMKFVRPELLLTVMATLALVFTVLTMTLQGIESIYALIAISGCMSLMFPTIYALGLAGLGQDTKLGGAGLVMAIVGGAVVTGIQGVVSDLFDDIQLAFLVPSLCFAAVAIYGIKARALRRQNKVVAE